MRRAGGRLALLPSEEPSHERSLAVRPAVAGARRPDEPVACARAGRARAGGAAISAVDRRRGRPRGHPAADEHLGEPPRVARPRRPPRARPDRDRVLDENRTGERYLGEFLRVLRRYGPQSYGIGQPDVEKVIADLQAHPSWPKVKVDFDVVARTHLGQDVYVTGSSKALGAWGAEGPGVKLETDPATYPDWRANDVALPLGARLEYKVVKRDADGRVEWEPGENAVLIVDPTLGEPADSTKDLGVKDAFGVDG